MKACPHLPITCAIAYLGVAGVALSLSLAPPRPLSERVAEAEKIFVGTVVNRVEKDGWVRAELRVDTPLRRVEAKQKVPVVWRPKIRDVILFDAEEGRRGIAILKDKHEGRYWLRADKFETVEKLEEVKKLVAENPEADADVPTFEEWMKAGKPIPKDRAFTGGTPWFDETTGKRRSAEEVYEMLYGRRR